MKKRKLLVPLLFLGLFLAILPGIADNGKSFLWEIQTPSGYTSFILGSIHFLKSDFYPLKPAIERAYDQTEALVVEADMSEEKIMEKSLLIFKRGTYEGNTTLKDVISPKTFELAKKYLSELNMEIEGLKKFKPWVIALIIESAQAMKMGYDPNHGIDKYFMDRAANNREIIELEGVEFQVNMLDSFTKEENENFLLSALEKNTTIEKNLNQLVDAWVNGDTKSLEDQLYQPSEQFSKMKSVYKKIIDDRNVSMTKKIIELLGQKKTFMIIVGAGHLVGKTGIIKALQDKGFRLKQL